MSPCWLYYRSVRADSPYASLLLGRWISVLKEELESLSLRLFSIGCGISTKLESHLQRRIK